MWRKTTEYDFFTTFDTDGSKGTGGEVWVFQPVLSMGSNLPLLRKISDGANQRYSVL